MVQPNRYRLYKITKFRDLGKQRERSLCSLKIKTLTNYPTNLIPSKSPTQTLFRTQNPKDVRDASRTTKVRDLGKQRERSLCSRKNQISTNHSYNLIPTKLFANSKFKRRTQRIQDLVIPFALYFEMRTKVI